MFFDAAVDTPLTDALVARHPRIRWGANSEYGRLTDVMLSAPTHLRMLPCNAVTRASIERGLACSPAAAGLQHDRLIFALSQYGVRCHSAPARPDLADLSFMRDAALMTPWGLLELRPGAPHRREEAAHVARTAATLGVPIFGRIEQGTVEGGDICVLRPGTVLIGYSGERTDKAGGRAVAALFEARGWEAIFYCFDPHFLHLDTQFTLVDRHQAVACVDVLEAGFLDRLADLEIDLIPPPRKEVRRLGANLLCLGDGCVLSPADNVRINRELQRRGYEVVSVDLDQFTRCGGASIA